MTYILYKTTNIVNGKYYIGVTNGNNPHYKGSGTALSEAIKIYGHDSFKRETLEVFETEIDAFRREAEVVTEDFVKNRDTYNIKVGGKGGHGQLKTKEHRKNISESIKKKLKTGELKSNGGRKPAMDNSKLFEIVAQFGIRKAADMLNLTYYQCRDRYYRAKKNATVVESGYTSDLKSDAARIEGSSPSSRTKDK